MAEEKTKKQQDDSDIFPNRMSSSELSELHRKGKIERDVYNEKYGNYGQSGPTFRQGSP